MPLYGTTLLFCCDSVLLWCSVQTGGSPQPSTPLTFTIQCNYHGHLTPPWVLLVLLLRVDGSILVRNPFSYELLSQCVHYSWRPITPDWLSCLLKKTETRGGRGGWTPCMDGECETDLCWPLYPRGWIIAVWWHHCVVERLLVWLMYSVCLHVCVHVCVCGWTWYRSAGVQERFCTWIYMCLTYSVHVCACSKCVCLCTPNNSNPILSLGSIL